MYIPRMIHIFIATLANLFLLNIAFAIPIIESEIETITFKFVAEKSDFLVTHDVWSENKGDVTVHLEWFIFDEDGKQLKSGSIGHFSPGEAFHDVFDWGFKVSGSPSQKGVSLQIKPRDSVPAPEPTTVWLLSFGLVLIRMCYMNQQRKGTPISQPETIGNMKLFTRYRAKRK